MNAMSAALNDYLGLRNCLGFKMEEAKRLLPLFLSFLDEHGTDSISAKLAVEWAVQPKTETKRYWAQRLSVVRGFAKYLHGIDPRTEVPPHGLLSYGSGRRSPHIYTDSEIVLLLNESMAKDTPPRLRAKTYTTLFGLLAVTGMRLNECLNLNDEDVDLANGLLTIRGSKWRKSRLVPIHVTTQEILRKYRCHKNRLYPHRETSSFFILDNGKRVRVSAAEREFAEDRLGKAPSVLTLQDLDAAFISAFLDHLEKDRHNTVRSRNARLAAIHSFFRYAALQCPEHSALIQRVLAMPSKQYEHPEVAFLTKAEVEALLAAPDQSTWTGRRDQALLLVAVQTGLRVSELIGLRCEDVVIDCGAHVHCRGKGRKERCTPLRKDAAGVLTRWLRERNGQTGTPLFPSARGGSLSRDGVEYLLNRHVSVASEKCPSLKAKRVSPHVLRHTCAMDLLQAGVDRAVIALWLGHETLNTVQTYFHANLKFKEAALAKTAPFVTRTGRYRPSDRLMVFLKSL